MFSFGTISRIRRAALGINGGFGRRMNLGTNGIGISCEAGLGRFTGLAHREYPTLNQNANTYNFKPSYVSINPFL